MSKKDFRTIETDDVELRIESEGAEEQRYVEGKGIVYDKEVEVWPGLLERFLPGAFEKTLSAHDEVKSFFNHNASQVLSTTRSKPALALDDRADALRYRSPLPPTSYGQDLRVNLERKNVRGSSFAFEVLPNGEKLIRDKDGVYHREIMKAVLYEIGPVTNPAYRQTTAGLRSAEEAFNDIKTVIEKRESEEKKGESDKRENELKLKRKLIDII